uniref:SH2 domain-containing protein 1A-like protein n=1 Tax=Callorhinchus milii TaxID=7868 RepID=V9LFT0_CALMI
MKFRRFGAKKSMKSLAYHGRINQKDTQNLLALSGKDGSYLIRDSETVPDTYCLCVLNKTFVHTYRISQTSRKWSVQTSKGIPLRLFNNIEELIATHQRPGQGTVVPLQHPVFIGTYNLPSQNAGLKGSQTTCNSRLAEPS